MIIFGVGVGILTCHSFSFSILPVKTRERALDIMVFRFGKATVEEHMNAKPHLTSYEDALRSLTLSFDNDGKQDVFYGNGDKGKSVQFCAVLDENSDFVSNGSHDHHRLHYHNKEKAHQKFLLRTNRVIGSVEAVRFSVKDNEPVKGILIELKNLSVHEIARRRGVGKALTKAVQQYARRQICLRQKQRQQQNKPCPRSQCRSPTAYPHIVLMV